MSATLTIRIRQGVKDRLGTLAQHQQCSMSLLAGAAIEDYLAVEERQMRRIGEALDAADRGEGVPHEKVMAWLDSWGTKKELPMPKA